MILIEFFFNEKEKEGETRWNLVKNKIWMNFSNGNVVGGEITWNLAQNTCENKSGWNFLMKLWQGTKPNEI